MHPEPPTVAHLKGHGLESLFVTCSNLHCMHAAPFTFAALGLADELPFRSIAQRKRFLCTRCGGRTVNVSPDWRAHRAQGAARLQWGPPP